MAPSTNTHLKHADMNNVRDYAADRSLKSSDAFYTTANGVRVAHAYETQRAGENGPLLLQDFHLIDLLSHFDRERIPERVVHAKGAGAHGFFECTNPLTEFCKSDIFSSAGKTCPIDVRFSTVGGESGSHDCARDPRGFSVNLHTDEGAWSWVFNNTPVFFLRDPAKFPHFIHTQKRAPDSHLTHADDSTVFWDYLSQNPESVHQVMILFGDRGIPDGYRHMNGYSGHTFKLVNDDNEWVYCQIHLKSNQGVKFITQEDSANYSPDYSTKDLFNAINEGNFPSWTVSVQTMTAKEAEEVWADGINVFDLTHVWPQGRFPLREVGKITLNENPVNYFSEVEQIAFNPAHLIPGIVASNDPVLQSRLFSYPDAHRHRLGVNYMQLPINAPKVPYPMANFQRDGQMAFFNQGARPNYISSIDPIKFEHEKADDLDAVHGHFVGNAVRFLSEIRPEDFNAPRILWQKVFDDGAKERFINNVSGHMSTCTKPEILRRQLAIFHQVSPDIAQRLSKAIDIKDYETDFSKLSFNGEHNGFATKDHLKAANGQARLPRPKDNGAPIKGSHGSRGTINKTPTANGNGVNGHTNGVNGH